MFVWDEELFDKPTYLCRLFAWLGSAPLNRLALVLIRKQ